MYEALNKTDFKIIEDQKLSESAKFMKALKEGSEAGKEFMDSLKEADKRSTGKGFMESLKDNIRNHANDVDVGRNLSHITSGFIPRSGGDWKGNPGDSDWKPDRDKKPENPKTNPEGKTWGEILDKYGIERIPFKDGEPDFSEVSKGTVEIDDFSEDRDDNFDAADEKLAEQRGCTKEEVRKWRQEHRYTWHERGDMKTMDKVPTEVHGNVPHEGGISAKKKENEHG
jgi:hypothetical protein